MSNWPIVAASGITGGTAVIGYIFGDRSSKRTTAATMNQIESENRRVVQTITAENERLREQHREDHLRNRQNTYHAFMNADRRLAALFAFGAQPVTRETYDEVSTQLLDLFNGVLLFGAAPVRRAAQDLFDRHADVFDAFIRDTTVRPFAERMGDAFVAHMDAVDRARVECFRVMHDDVAADL